MRPVAAVKAPDELASGAGDPTRRGVMSTWFWRWPAGLALVLLAVLVGPDLLASSAPVPVSPEPSGRALPPLPALAPPAPRPAAPLEWPVRGDLARDAAFLQAALQRVRQQDPAATRVLFATTLPDDSRVALVALARSDPVSDLGRGVHMRALHVPVGATVADGAPVPVGSLLEDDDLVGWAGRATGGRIFAVVLGRPGPLQVEVSSLIQYHRDGGSTRRWTREARADGSVVLDLGRRSDQIVAVRARGTRPDTYPLVLSVDHDPRARPTTPRLAPDTAAVQGLDSAGYRGPEPGLVVRALAQEHEYRFDPATADLRILWSGEVEPGHRAALVRARRPDGPVFQLLVTQTGDAAATHGPRHVPWDDADVTPWLYVQGKDDKPVLLLNPSGRGFAVLAEAGAPPRTVKIGRDGVAVLEGTTQARMFTGLSGARLTVLRPAGAIAVSTSLSALGLDDVFVLR